MSLFVLCLKWGTKYNDDYVRRLAGGVARNLTLDHEFICLTDREVRGINCAALPSNLPGWWAKIGLFRPDILDGDKLYLDLDVVVTGSLDSLVPRQPTTKVWALDDFSYSLRVPKVDIDPETKSLLGGIGTCNSSIMYWQNEFGSDVWDKFQTETMKRLHGDQNWITQCLWPHSLELYPAEIASSYKYDWLAQHRHRGSVMVFHGDPKPHDLDTLDPFRKLWEQ